jgi:hypothetical protein
MPIPDLLKREVRMIRVFTQRYVKTLIRQDRLQTEIHRFQRGVTKGHLTGSFGW